MKIYAVLAVAAALLGFPGAAQAQLSFEQRLADAATPLVMAHRSAVMGGLPENSLAWIQFAIDRGVDMVHVNPQLTADDRYILMHDNTLNRTTDVERVFPAGPPNGPTRAQRGGRDYVRDYTLAEIRTLRLTNGADGGTYDIPTLEQALDLAQGKILVVLGLKTYETGSLAAVLKGRETGNLLLSDLYTSGTDQSRLRGLSEASGVDAGVVLFRSGDYAADLEAIAGQLGSALAMVWVGSSGLTEDFITSAQDRKLRIAIGGWDGPEDSALARQSDPGPWKVLLDRGFIAATDQPELVLEILGR